MLLVNGLCFLPIFKSFSVLQVMQYWIIKHTKKTDSISWQKSSLTCLKITNDDNEVDVEDSLAHWTIFSPNPQMSLPSLSEITANERVQVTFVKYTPRHNVKTTWALNQVSVSLQSNWNTVHRHTQILWNNTNWSMWHSTRNLYFCIYSQLLVSVAQANRHG